MDVEKLMKEKDASFITWFIIDNKDPKQCLLSLVVKLGTISLLPGQGTNPSYKQCNIKETHHLKSILAKDLHDENVWHQNLSKSSVIQFFEHLTNFFIFNLVKFYCFPNSFVPMQHWSQTNDSGVDHQR